MLTLANIMFYLDEASFHSIFWLSIIYIVVDNWYQIIYCNLKPLWTLTSEENGHRVIRSYEVASFLAYMSYICLANKPTLQNVESFQ